MRVFLLLLLAFAGTCSRAWTPEAAFREAPPPPSTPVGCALTVRFYDVGQGLAALVELPDGRRVLVDAGDSPRREGCEDVCPRAHQHLLAALERDLAGAPLDLMWLTHPHSDHVGGAPEVLAAERVLLYVDNGRDGSKAEVRRAREAALARGTAVRVVDPDHREAPLPASPGVTLTSIVPPAWPRSCREDANECSIGLRIDACGASILFTGDAEREEESALDPGGPVTLLQVAHHGSETSTSAAWLARLRPRYAVVSAGKPGEGLNRDYCLPRADVVERLTRALPPGPPRPLVAFGHARCDRATAADWQPVDASPALFATERDGDVVLTTTGGGVFRRIPEPSP